MDARKAKLPQFYMEFLRALCLMFAVNEELKWGSFAAKFTEDAWRTTTYDELQQVAVKLVRRLQGRFSEHEVKSALRAFEKVGYIERLSPFDPKKSRRILYLRLRADRIIYTLQKLKEKTKNDFIPPPLPSPKSGPKSPAITGPTTTPPTANDRPIFDKLKQLITSDPGLATDDSDSAVEVQDVVLQEKKKLEPQPASPAGLEISLFFPEQSEKEKLWESIVAIIKNDLFNIPEADLSAKQERQLKHWVYHPTEASRMTVAALTEYVEYRFTVPHDPGDWFFSCTPDFLIQNWPVVYKNFKRSLYFNRYHNAVWILNECKDPDKEFEKVLAGIALEIVQSGMYPTGGDPAIMLFGLVVATIRNDAQAIGQYQGWLPKIKQCLQKEPGLALLARKLYPQALERLALSPTNWEKIEADQRVFYEQLLADKAIGEVLEMPSEL